MAKPSESERLFSELQQLESDEHQILLAFAVVYEAIGQTQMQRLLAHLGWKDRNGKSLKPLMAKPLREKLLTKKLLVKSQNGYTCQIDVANKLAREAAKRGLYHEVAITADKILGMTYSGYYYNNTPTNADYRRIREQLYTGDSDAVLAVLDDPRYSSPELIGFILVMSMREFDPIWFATLSEPLQAIILAHFYTRYDMTPYHPSLFDRYMPETPVLDASCAEYQYLSRLCDAKSDNTTRIPALYQLLVKWRLGLGQLDGIDLWLSQDQSWQMAKMKAWSLCVGGDFSSAIPIFEHALKQGRKETKQRRLHFEGWPGLLFLIALLSSDNPEHHKLLEKQIKLIYQNKLEGRFFRCVSIIDAIKEVLLNNEKLEHLYTLSNKKKHNSLEECFLACFGWHWLGERPTNDMLKQLADYIVEEKSLSNQWLLKQLIDLFSLYPLTKNSLKGKSLKLFNLALSIDKQKQSSNASQKGVLVNQLGSILYLIQPQAPWQRALAALQDINTATPQNNNSELNARLIWVISEGWSEHTLQPKEQKAMKRGGWTKGRNIALKRLYREPESFPYLSEEDKKICRCISEGSNYYGYSDYTLSSDSALQAAVGHPLLFWEHNLERNIELTQGEPDLIVRERAQSLHIHLDPSPNEEEEGEPRLFVHYETDYRLKLIKFNNQHRQIYKILGEHGLNVPLQAKDQVLKSISAVAPLIAIQSDIGGGDINAVAIAADSRPYMLMQPQGAGIKFNLAVFPLGPDGPQFLPGEGRAMVTTEVSGERRYTERNLAEEVAASDALLAHCTALNGWESDAWDAKEHEWEALEDYALEALLQLQEYGEGVVLFWPKGGKLTLNPTTDVKHIRASIRQEKDWFSLEGELNVNEERVITLAELIALAQKSPGRFIPLGDDEFITLTKQLRKRIDSLYRHGEKQHYHSLASHALETLTDGMELQSDECWLTQKQRIEEAYQIDTAVPVTLQANLRDYQQEGFSWLARLAHWGAGACLADDMGLGKTLQALALIVSRASLGPTLVLAPTSVCLNWYNETQRFAPTLNPVQFGQGGKAGRQTHIDQAGPFDLVICSYGLLATEQERLQSIRWCNIVADEAQALKNPQAKRTQAALALNAGFKLVTTGTPIENHLGELWTLFRFINPGLLGSLESFNKRFAGPIENHQDSLAGEHLKRLVQPFILRRLKTDVLNELPPRTEITISVPLSQDERAFYEALRRQAVENLTEKNKDEKPGSKQLKALAEIMRLRRACCNPRLITPETQIPSAKLDAFAEIVEELIENNHRALVFSQFVGHLELVREYLDQRNMIYQYLDGSTPIKQREKAVNRFQSGEGDVFLISLKAGGSGLNLTAADYVIHLDPWWNPAVEDQASDRAHRMGQKRPVTIYRLVAENTIEQKIINLHSEKRDLADSLLDGSDMSGKLSLDEMMNLIDTI